MKNHLRQKPGGICDLRAGTYTRYHHGVETPMILIYIFYLQGCPIHKIQFERAASHYSLA